MQHLLIGATALLAAAAQAQTSAPTEQWQFGAVLDATATSRALELGTRDQGLQLGHSDLTASGPVGLHLQAQITGVLETHDGELESAFEEAWLETRTLPLGLTARVGRFASQIGYLNQQHPHADDFVERPLLYRAFLGGHWNDDGVRLNLTLPTRLYWMVGAEAFRGRRLIAETDEPVNGAGAFTLTTKLGGDFDRSNSWQLGLSYLKSRRIAALEAHEEHGEHEAEEEGHEEEGHDDHAHHHHGAAFGGRHTWMVDATWKWAPAGNNSDQQVRVSVEAAQISGINRFASSQDRHKAYALSAVWRFHPNWETGVRFDRLRVAMPHGDHFHDGRLDETALMLAWKPSHGQSLRLQYTTQDRALGFEHPAKRAIQLQYVIAFGAHGAHSY